MVAPRMNLLKSSDNVNCEYANFVAHSKDCYFIFNSGGGGGNENCYFGWAIDDCKDSFDINSSKQCIECYDTLNSNRSNKIFFSKNTTDTLSSNFMYDCRNCIDCIGCVELRNKSYNILNKQYTKEEYLKKKKELDLGSYKNTIKFKEKVYELYIKYPKKYANIVKSENIIGDNILNSKNCFYAFDSYKAEDCKYILRVINSRNSYDMCSNMDSELCIDGLAVLRSSLIKFSTTAIDCMNSSYVDSCFNCSNIFGSISLRKKEYCILNKQYTKEEYEELVAKIIKHMGG